MTKTEHLLTISIQYHAQEWWEQGKYQLRDYQLIQLQILGANVIRIVWKSVRRIADKILGVKGFRDQSLIIAWGWGGWSILDVARSNLPKSPYKVLYHSHGTPLPLQWQSTSSQFSILFFCIRPILPLFPLKPRDPPDSPQSPFTHCWRRLISPLFPLKTTWSPKILQPLTDR